MELGSLNSKSLKKNRKRVGRGPGSGHGKTSCKGHKGAQARSGYSRNFGFEGGQIPLHRRLPKRGFNHASRAPVATVNIDILMAAFEEGDTITTADIVVRGLAKDAKGGIKLLGRGDVTKKVTIKIQACSPSAKEKIEAAGGAVELATIASDASGDSAEAASSSDSSDDSSSDSQE